VFVKDRFELVRPHDFPESELARAHASPYLDMPRAGPDVVGSRFPKDNAERQRIMFLGSSGVDLQHMPQHYVPFEEVRAEVLARAEPLSRLAALNPGREPEIDAIAEASGVPREAIVFLPMRVGPRDLTVLLDRRGGRRFNIGALRPWEY